MLLALDATKTVSQTVAPMAVELMGQVVKILPQPVPWQNVKILSWLVLWQDFELVPLSRDNEGTSVPLYFCPGGQENPAHWKPYSELVICK